MKNKIPRFDGIFTKKYTPLICILALLCFSIYSRTAWINKQQKEFSKISQDLRHHIETRISKDQKLSPEEIQNLLKSNNRVTLS